MSIKAPVRFAFVGCGSISKKHIAAISEQKEAELVGVFDVSESYLSSFEKDNKDIPLFDSIDPMIKQTDPDVLCILSPSGFHSKNFFDLAKYNKHFIIEKPLALKFEDTKKMKAVCDHHDIKVFVCLQNRYNPPIRKIKETLDEGLFGDLVIGTVRARWTRKQSYYDQKPWRGTWELDGGVLTNQASHHIDALLWMMGDVDTVVAKSATRLVNIEAEDTGVAILKFKNGALGVIEATTATRPIDLGSSLSVLGQKASVEVGGYFMNEIKTWNFEKATILEEKDKKVPDVFAWNHSKFYENIISDLKGNSATLVNIDEASKSIKIINAIYDSIINNKEIKMDGYTPSEKMPLGCVKEIKK